MKERLHNILNAGDLTCPGCGRRDFVSGLESGTIPYGSGADATEVPVQLLVHTCRTCGEGILDESAEDAKHNAICEHLGLLTPREIAEIRVNLGLNRRQFAELTGFGEATIARWERGALVQNASSDRYLRLIRRCPGEAVHLVSPPEKKARALAERFRCLAPQLGESVKQARSFELAPCM